MQKVKLIRPTPGGAGVIKAGTIIDVSETEAAMLAKGGYIEAPEKPKPPQKPKKR